MIVIDMENPEDCDFCPFAFWNIVGKGLLGCTAKGHRYFTLKERAEDGKPDWCPIVGEIKVHNDGMVIAADLSTVIDGTDEAPYKSAIVALDNAPTILEGKKETS